MLASWAFGALRTVFGDITITDYQWLTREHGSMEAKLPPSHPSPSGLGRPGKLSGWMEYSQNSALDIFHLTSIVISSAYINTYFDLGLHWVGSR